MVNMYFSRLNDRSQRKIRERKT